MWFNLQTCRVKIWLVILFFAIVIIIGGVLAYRNHQNNVKRAEQILIQKRSERETLRSGLRDLEGTINNLHSRHRPTNLHDVERDLMRRTRSVDPFSPTKDAEKKEADGTEGEKCNMCVSCEKRDISVKALPNHDVCAFCKRLNEICSEPTEKAEMQEKLDQILTTAKDNQAKIGGLSFEETEKAILAKLDRILNNQKIDSDSDSGRDSDTDSDEESNKSKKRKVDGDEFAQIASPQPTNKRRLDSGDEDGAAKRKKTDEQPVATCESSTPSTSTTATSASPTTTTPTTAAAPTATTPSVGASTTATAQTTTTPSVDAAAAVSTASTTTTPSVDTAAAVSTAPPAAATEATVTTPAPSTAASTATTSSAAPPATVPTTTTPTTAPVTTTTEAVADAAACDTKSPAQTSATTTQPVTTDDATAEKKTVKQ